MYEDEKVNKRTFSYIVYDVSYMNYEIQYICSRTVANFSFRIHNPEDQPSFLCSAWKYPFIRFSVEAEIDMCFGNVREVLAVSPNLLDGFSPLSMQTGAFNATLFTTNDAWAVGVHDNRNVSSVLWTVSVIIDVCLTMEFKCTLNDGL